jgi:D-arginine dehydrogenase
MEAFEVVVVGAGIAGAAAAWALAADRRVLLLERESQPGYHTTGRSAALLTPYYGNALVRRLNLAGAAFYRAPPEGFAEQPVLAPRGALYIGREEQAALIDREVAQARALGGTAERLDATGARALVPRLRPEAAAHAWLDPEAADMDVGAILQGFLRLFRRRGGTVRTDAEALGLARVDGGWRVATRAGMVVAPVLVDAAGAWADSVAGLAGLAPLGIQPLRRTAILIEPPAGSDIRRWPAVADVAETFYFKPDAGKLLCSPADETPSDPLDAWADELDVAICVERVQAALEVEVRRIDHSWAGLRCFAPDRTPVVGFDPRAEGFFWLAGLGGYGIMMAPALAVITAHLVAGAALPEGLERTGFDPMVLSPARLLLAPQPGR